MIQRDRIYNSHRNAPEEFGNDAAFTAINSYAIIIKSFFNTPKHPYAYSSVIHTVLSFNSGSLITMQLESISSRL